MVTFMVGPDGKPIDYNGNRVGDVYFLQIGKAGLIKIGFSTDLDGRLKTLRCGHPKLRLLGSVPGTLHDERRWHVELREHRVGGEWFKATPYVRSRINSAIESKGWFGSELIEKSRNSPEQRRLKYKRCAKSKG